MTRTLLLLAAALGCTSTATYESDLVVPADLEVTLGAVRFAYRDWSTEVAEIVDRYASKARAQITGKSEQKAFLRELVAFLDGPEVHQDLARGHLDGAIAGAKALLEKHARRSRTA